MVLHRQSFVAVAIVMGSFCSIPLTVCQSSRAPEWKEDSDAYSNSYLKSITKGSELSLLCSAKGNPRPDLLWRKDNVTFVTKSEKVKLKGYRLKITDIHPADHGNYTCIANNSLGIIEFTFLVDVKEAPEWKEDSDAYNNFSMKSATEGTELKLSCATKGNPKPDVFWHRNGAYSEKVKVKGNNLKFTEIQTSDHGSYTCAANNSISKIEFTFMVDVKTTTTRVSTTTQTTTQTTTRTTKTRQTVPEKPRTDKVNQKKKKKPLKKNHYKKEKPKKNKQKKKDPGYDDDFDIVDNNGLHTETPYVVDNDHMLGKDLYVVWNTNNVSDKMNFKDNMNIKEPNEANFDTNSETDNYDTYSTPHPDDGDNMNMYNHDISNTERQNATNVTSSSRGGISIWTVYIIVGAIAGGLLLAGLVAIAIAIFCQREDESQYKSTSV